MQPTANIGEVMELTDWPGFLTHIRLLSELTSDGIKYGGVADDEGRSI